MNIKHARKVASSCLFLALSALLILTIANARPASAMEIVARGDTIFLGGSIKPGDSIEFSNFVKKAQKGTYKNVYLASGGGFISEAIDIGRTIRQEGLSTIVDASKSFCASACTAIFASGVKRIYMNAMAIPDGMPKKGCAGLGFHDGSNASSLAANHYSGGASAMMIDAYYEFGVPRAAEVISKAPPDNIFLLSGQTALALGIATNIGTGKM
jgi:hypothetical protein